MEQKLFNEKLSHNCLIRIQSIYNNLKTAEKKAADFILENPEIIADRTIVEAAALAGCSEATLVRVARKLGYSGYVMLKASILQDEESEPNLLYGEIKPNDEPVDVANKIFQTFVQSLLDTLGLLNSTTYLQALDRIQHAKQILFVGAGDAYAVAFTGYLKFSRIGYHASCPQDFDIQLMEASKLGPDDLFIVISHTGQTQSLYEVEKYVKRRGVPVLAITNYPMSPIAKTADLVLLTATFVPNMFGEIMTKRVAELCLLETLYVNTVMRADGGAGEQLKNATKAISINKL